MGFNPRFPTALTALVLFAIAPDLSSAQTPPLEDRLAFAPMLRAIRIKGDLTLRSEHIMRSDPGTYDQYRGRYRWRLGLEADLPERFTVLTQLASGTGSQVAAFQTLGKASGQKGIYINAVWLRWTPELLKDGTTRVAAGKMENLLWRPYSADTVWDPDFTPEGFQQNVEYSFPESGVVLFANAMQDIVEEDTATARNRWLFAQQAGADVPLPGGARLKAAAGYDKWSGTQSGPLNAPAPAIGNRKSGTVLANRFGVGELLAEVTARPGGLPLSVQGSAIRNFLARGDLAGGAQRDGYEFGFILGKAAKKGTWEAAAFKRWVQADATVADLTDSEFGEGGTNRWGYVSWLAYAPRDWMRASVKYYYTQKIDGAMPAAPDHTRRFQMDLSLNF